MNLLPLPPVAHPRIRGGSEANTFGMVRHHADGTPKAHQGWDFAAAIGTPIVAVADGVVESVSDRGDYGMQIVLRLGVPVAGAAFAFYAHLASVEVVVGQRVTAGQSLGTTGNSGNAAHLAHSEDHLHFEVRTIAHPGLGLEGRISPAKWYGAPPYGSTP